MARVLEYHLNNASWKLSDICFNNAKICNATFFPASMQNDSIAYIKNSTEVDPAVWVPSSQLKITLCILYSLIFFCGVTGNGLVCFVLGIKNKKKNRYDILLLSLAIADLLASVFAPLIMISDLAGDLNRWYFGAAMCKVLPAISPITLIASSWSLAMISYDRYRVISRAAISRQKLDVKIIATQVIVIWAIAVCVCLPYVMGTRLHGDECYTTSVLDNKHLVVYAASWVLIGWGIPLTVISLFSVAIARILKEEAASGMNCTIVLRRVKRNRKVFQMFAIVFLAFFLLTTPYSIFYAVGTYLMYIEPMHTDLNTLKQLNYALFVLMVANSCVNPIIYAKMHREISVYAKKLRDRAPCVSNIFRKHLLSRYYGNEYVLSSAGRPQHNNINVNVHSPTASCMV